MKCLHTVTTTQKLREPPGSTDKTSNKRNSALSECYNLATYCIVHLYNNISTEEIIKSILRRYCLLLSWIFVSLSEKFLSQCFIHLVITVVLAEYYVLQSTSYLALTITISLLYKNQTKRNKRNQPKVDKLNKIATYVATDHRSSNFLQLARSIYMLASQLVI